MKNLKSQHARKLAIFKEYIFHNHIHVLLLKKKIYNVLTNMSQVITETHVQ